MCPIRQISKILPKTGAKYFAGTVHNVYSISMQKVLDINNLGMGILCICKLIYSTKPRGILSRNNILENKWA